MASVAYPSYSFHTDLDNCWSFSESPTGPSSGLGLPARSSQPSPTTSQRSLLSWPPRPSTSTSVSPAFDPWLDQENDPDLFDERVVEPNREHHSQGDHHACRSTACNEGVVATCNARKGTVRSSTSRAEPSTEPPSTGRAEPSTKPPPKKRRRLSPSEPAANRGRSRSGSELWEFLGDLLSDGSGLLRWRDDIADNVFQIVSPYEVAKRWGQTKNIPNMQYQSMARALRKCATSKSRMLYKYKGSHKDFFLYCFRESLLPFVKRKRSGSQQRPDVQTQDLCSADTAAIDLVELLCSQPTTEGESLAVNPRQESPLEDAGFQQPLGTCFGPDHVAEIAQPSSTRRESLAASSGQQCSVEDIGFQQSQDTCLEHSPCSANVAEFAQTSTRRESLAIISGQQCSSDDSGFHQPLDTCFGQDSCSVSVAVFAQATMQRESLAVNSGQHCSLDDSGFHQPLDTCFDQDPSVNMAEFSQLATRRERLAMISGQRSSLEGPDYHPPQDTCLDQDLCPANETEPPRPTIRGENLSLNPEQQFSLEDPVSIDQQWLGHFFHQDVCSANVTECPQLTTREQSLPVNSRQQSSVVVQDFEQLLDTCYPSICSADVDNLDSGQPMAQRKSLAVNQQQRCSLEDSDCQQLQDSFSNQDLCSMNVAELPSPTRRDILATNTRQQRFFEDINPDFQQLLDENIFSDPDLSLADLGGSPEATPTTGVESFAKILRQHWSLEDADIQEMLDVFFDHDSCSANVAGSTTPRPTTQAENSAMNPRQQQCSLENPDAQQPLGNNLDQDLSSASVTRLGQGETSLDQARQFSLEKAVFQEPSGISLNQDLRPVAVTKSKFSQPSAGRENLAVSSTGQPCSLDDADFQQPPSISSEQTLWSANLAESVRSTTRRKSLAMNQESGLQPSLNDAGFQKPLDISLDKDRRLVNVNKSPSPTARKNLSLVIPVPECSLDDAHADFQQPLDILVDQDRQSVNMTEPAQPAALRQSSAVDPGRQQFLPSEGAGFQHPPHVSSAEYQNLCSANVNGSVFSQSATQGRCLAMNSVQRRCSVEAPRLQQPPNFNVAPAQGLCSATLRESPPLAARENLSLVNPVRQSSLGYADFQQPLDRFIDQDPCRSANVTEPAQPVTRGQNLAVRSVQQHCSVVVPPLQQPQMVSQPVPPLQQPQMVPQLIPQLQQPQMVSQPVPQLQQPQMVPQLQQPQMVSQPVPQLQQPQMIPQLIPPLQQPQMVSQPVPQLQQPQIVSQPVPQLQQPQNTFQINIVVQGTSAANLALVPPQPLGTIAR